MNHATKWPVKITIYYVKLQSCATQCWTLASNKRDLSVVLTTSTGRELTCGRIVYLFARSKRTVGSCVSKHSLLVYINGPVFKASAFFHMVCVRTDNEVQESVTYKSRETCKARICQFGTLNPLPIFTFYPLKYSARVIFTKSLTKSWVRFSRR